MIHKIKEERRPLVTRETECGLKCINLYVHEMTWDDSKVDCGICQLACVENQLEDLDDTLV